MSKQREKQRELRERLRHLTADPGPLGSGVCALMNAAEGNGATEVFREEAEALLALLDERAPAGEREPEGELLGYMVERERIPGQWVRVWSVSTRWYSWDEAVKERDAYAEDGIPARIRPVFIGTAPAAQQESGAREDTARPVLDHASERVLRSAERLVDAYQSDGNGVGVRACEDSLIAAVENMRAHCITHIGQPAAGVPAPESGA